MIESVKIHNVATYKNLVEIKPKKLNFIYGSNGSGKTTISKVLASSIESETTRVTSRNPNDDKILVYNKQFVNDNFQQFDNLKGIFTLGEDSIDAQEKLNMLSRENEAKKSSIEIKEKTISKFDIEIKEMTDTLKEKCWQLQRTIGDTFSQALVGYRNSKQKFYEKCLTSYEEWDEESTINLEQLKSDYDMAYSKSSVIYPIFSEIENVSIKMLETSELLSKVITGSGESPIGIVIDILKNSDWIQQGIEYMQQTENKCPFCQQVITNELQQEIIQYFDEEYEKDCTALDVLLDEYTKCCTKVLHDLEVILNNDIPFIDKENLRVEYQLLRSVIQLNFEEMKKKRQFPSNKVSLQSTEDRFEKINTIIREWNGKILSNNNIVENQEHEQKQCTELLWQYIVSNLSIDIETYNKFLKGKNDAKQSINGQIITLKDEIKKNTKEIEDIEDSITSVAPTVTEINKILDKFDFKGFKLKENEQQKGSYSIIRNDGSSAKDTLSEGEYNFITFLYFYYLIYGSQDKTGITSNKIIVIDDPISSLDSNVLFIVSTLVKNLLKDCRRNKNGILQTFILTHNVYFHKEITFLGSGKEFSSAEVLFGVIRKRDNISYFTEYDRNPIESTYQLLWRELLEDKLSTVTSFNTMRRILEYYFKIIGDLNYEKCIEKFDGNDKIVCKALVSCINDGSHFISDDFVITFDEENIENYKRIFKLIFKELGHESHYNMMMKAIN
ncbi:AAA family ATPase [Enterococcus faecalis]|uniref:AAA family ATPase n=1 Tax=Enterococcus faecalis TaxID=1351 RepID=UPI001157CEE0|nr:AAA family ATPase [Enterococcus faecalis]EGO7700112.1 AAA family ATPase [Enterococcus faecalis]EGO8067719.1 AAA family ATPase [Enterococcus faecalis]EGO8194618.1 AAA family ATPase [Enterococcus faecalis]EGO8485643.1 ATP-binding protein [Enterococcus faecalis]EHQ9005349.1 AAA family ATPase [Enterococcus faecalis]